MGVVAPLALSAALRAELAHAPGRGDIAEAPAALAFRSDTRSRVETTR